MGWEDYGSEGHSRPPPELFGFNQVRDAVFGDAEYACCGGESSDSTAATTTAATTMTRPRPRPL